MFFVKQQSRNGVIALNVLLVIILAAVVVVPTSSAQHASDNNQYIAIPSIANGIPTGAVYLLESTRQELVALAWNRDQNKIKILGYRNVRDDADSVPKK
jgi:hypothetical protein|tara:strand:+ start:136 stop:432 length:297 start_codon:yes stop_codon:yes gene_type:complete